MSKIQLLVVGVGGWIVVHVGLVLFGAALGGGATFLHFDDAAPKDTCDASICLDPDDKLLLVASARAAQEWEKYGEDINIGEGVQVLWNPAIKQNGLPVAAAVYESGGKIEVNSTLYKPGDCLWCALFHEIGHLLDYEHGDDHYGLSIPPAPVASSWGSMPPSPTPVPTPVEEGIPIALSFYTCPPFCGTMTNGETVHEGASACGYAFELGMRFTIDGDPTGRTYTCKDRGSGPYYWTDIFFTNSATGWAWQEIVGTTGMIHREEK